MQKEASNEDFLSSFTMNSNSEFFSYANVLNVQKCLSVYENALIHAKGGMHGKFPFKFYQE
jgi:hypothetical protein